jgi:hypothetical protein
MTCNNKKFFTIIRRRVRVVYSDDEDNGQVSQTATRVEDNQVPLPTQVPLSTQVPLFTHATQRTRGRKLKSINLNENLDESTQVVETYVTQTQLGRVPLASKALNFEFESIPMKKVNCVVNWSTIRI